MVFLRQFRWFRRWRGGRWALVGRTLFPGQRWMRVTTGREPCEEQWHRTDLAAFSGEPRGRGYRPDADPNMERLSCRWCSRPADCWVNPRLVPAAAGAFAICAICRGGRPLLSIPHPEHCPGYTGGAALS